MKKRMRLITLVLAALIALPLTTVEAQMSRQQRNASVPTDATLRNMIANPMNFMVLVPAGSYTRGLETRDGGNAYTVPHSVHVDSFYISIYPVTQAEYTNNLPLSERHSISSFRGNNRPEENVNWFDAIAYCNALSRKHGLTPVYTVSAPNNRGDRTVTWNRNANGYRLPTEAEWEYACRAGTTTQYSTGNSISQSQATFDAIAGGRGARQTHSSTTPVGTYRSNPWGIYDMHGNVWEWCWDWYGEYPVQRGAPLTNPRGPDNGENMRFMLGEQALSRRQDLRVIRGGSWYYAAAALRSGNRNAALPEARPQPWDEDVLGGIGFRVVRNAR